MAEISELALERLKRETDNGKVSVADLLALVMDSLERMDGHPIRAIVIVETERPDGWHDIEAFRCGCNRYEEIALLRVHEARRIELWRGRADA